MIRVQDKTGLDLDISTRIEDGTEIIVVSRRAKSLTPVVIFSTTLLLVGALVLF